MKIVYVSGTRADYELMRPVLSALRRDPYFKLQILVTGMHLRPRFGYTVRNIKADGFPILGSVDTLHTQSTTDAMTVSLGRTIVGISKVFSKNRPDLVLLSGDRDEHLAGSVCASHMNILNAQIHAGERSGNIDDCNRHAISRYAHLHFAATQDSRTRLLAMGEEKFRIHVVGAPAIDQLKITKFLSRAELRKMTGVDVVNSPYLVLLQHAVTSEEKEAGRQIKETLAAIRSSKLRCIAFVPNADAGGELIAQQLRRAKQAGHLELLVHLRQREYASLLKHSVALIGNSSSGIIEAPYLSVPVINIGTRQSFRYRGSNVIEVDYERSQIQKAIERCRKDRFRKALKKDRFLYGNGTAASKIVRVLRNFPWNDPRVRMKRITY